MIWAIYGGLTAATLVLLAVPAVRVVREARTLNRVVSAAGRRMEIAVAELNEVHDQRQSRLR